MKRIFQKYLPIIALVTGFLWAFITAGVHSMLFVFLPLLAFIFGYFSTWRWGLLNGFLLFLGYTFANAMMWFGISPNLLYALQYLGAFIAGGFSILLIGTLAPFVRKGFCKPASIAAALAVLAVVVWCGSLAQTGYNYYYQVIIHSSEDLDGLEVYMPAGTVSGEMYEELYDYPYWIPGHLTRNYAKEMLDTEHGRMLKLTVSELMDEGPRGYPYTVNIIFEMENPPHNLIKLMPRYDVVPVDRVESQRYIGPVRVKGSKVIEEFKVPIMVKSDTNADFELRLENRTGYGEKISFSYSKSTTYTELIRYEGHTGDEWLLVPVEVTERLNIRGIGD